VIEEPDLATKVGDMSYPAPGNGAGAPLPSTVRAAGALVGLQGVATIGFVVFELVSVRSATLAVGAVLGEAGTFLLFGVLLLVIARGLWRGRFWSRTPAVVVQILLLPVGYSLLVPSHQVLPGALVALVALVGLGLLLCAPSRVWSENLDQARREV
jgi:hypothetical protein